MASMPQHLEEATIAKGVATEILGPAAAGTAVAMIGPLQVIEAGLAALRQESDAADWDVETAKGEAAAREFRARCVKVRTAADAAYEQGNKPLLAAQRQARELVKRIQGFVQPIEDKWDAQIKAKEARKARERAAREQAERLRVDELRRKIAAYHAAPSSLVGAPAKDIADSIVAVESWAVDDATFGEFADEASGAKLAALSRLRAMHAATVEREAEAARLQAEREELARQHAKLKRDAAIRERINAIHLMPAQVGDSAASAIALMEAVDALPLTEAEFGEFLVEAQLAASVALGKLSAARDARLAREREQAEREEQLLREQAEREAEAAKRKRLDDEARATREAEAAELRRQQDAFEEEKRLAREQIEAEQRALREAEAARRAEAGRIEAERIAAEKAAEARMTQLADDARDRSVLGALCAAFDINTATAIDWIDAFNVERQRAYLLEVA